jgi:RHS repeat-associated protein
VPCGLQNLHYTYDPVGNITHIRDDAQQTIFFRNKRVEPSAEYTYDAIYRLIEAKGREHLGQVGGAPIPHSYNDVPRVGIDWSANDGNAMGTYIERYVYDAVGNFLEMQHRGSDPVHPGWTRSYAYNEVSLMEPGNQSNRLTSTTIGTRTETYSTAGDGYDAHGNMLYMPQLQIMQWDYKDQQQMTQRQKINDEDADGVARQGERTYYVYDVAGQRVRKVTELANGNLKDERIYLGGFEIYRRHSGSNAGMVRESLHIMDDKQRIALVETRNAVDDGTGKQLIRYQSGNHLGSVSLELDEQAQLVSYEEYTPYGSASYQAVRSQTETAKRYRYTGTARDEESGLYYHGTRYHAPWLTRWINPDPEGLVDGPNIYAYAVGDPVRFIDHTGTHVTDSLAGTIGNRDEYLAGRGTTGRYLFTQGGGWIDLSHAEPVHVWQVLQDIAAGRPVTMPLNGLQRTYTPRSRLTDPADIERAAISITHDFLYRYERYQRNRTADVLAATPFSYEDVTSNRVGIEIGIRFFRRAQQEGLDVTQSIQVLRADRRGARLYAEVQQQVIDELNPVGREQARRQYYNFVAQFRLVTSGEWLGQGRFGQVRDYSPLIRHPRNYSVRPYRDSVLSPVDPAQTPTWLRSDPASPSRLGITSSGSSSGPDVGVQIMNIPSDISNAASEALRQLENCAMRGGEGCFY